MTPIAISLLTVCGIEDLPQHEARAVTHAFLILDPQEPDPPAFLRYGAHHHAVLRCYDAITPGGPDVVLPRYGHRVGSADYGEQYGSECSPLREGAPCHTSLIQPLPLLNVLVRAGRQCALPYGLMDGVPSMRPQPLLTTMVSRPEVRQLVLERGRAERHYWRDLWHYRELFAILAWRDVAVRYKQTVIGAAWAVMRPFMTMIVFTAVFGHVAKLPSDGSVPYSVLVFAGMLPWFLFSTILSDASGSLVGNANLIGKVYFPRLIVPGASAVVALVDFLISFALLALLMLWFGIWPNWQIVLLPVFVLLAVIASLGPALYITALNVKYRDFRYIIPFIVQFGLYVSPVGFSSNVVPEQWRVLYSLNPMVGVIDGFRWCLLGGQSRLDATAFLASLVTTTLLLYLGVQYFRKTERGFADLL